MADITSGPQKNSLEYFWHLMKMECSACIILLKYNAISQNSQTEQEYAEEGNITLLQYDYASQKRQATQKQRQLLEENIQNAKTQKENWIQENKHILDKLPQDEQQKLFDISNNIWSIAKQEFKSQQKWKECLSTYPIRVADSSRTTTTSASASAPAPAPAAPAPAASAPAASAPAAATSSTATSSTRTPSPDFTITPSASPAGIVTTSSSSPTLPTQEDIDNMRKAEQGLAAEYIKAWQLQTRTTSLLQKDKLLLDNPDTPASSCAQHKRRPDSTSSSDTRGALRPRVGAVAASPNTHTTNTSGLSM